MDKNRYRVSLIIMIYCFIAFAVLLFYPKYKIVFAENIKEYTVKAAFTLNFARYTKWPPESFTDISSPCLLLVVGDMSIEPAFKTVTGEKIGSRKLMVEFDDDARDTGMYHMIFISRTVKAPIVSKILESVKGKPVVTIGEKKDFIKQGGMINFFTKNGRLYFEVNMDIIRQQNVKLSSRLLKLSILVGNK